MADNIPPDEIRRRLVIFLRIPNEVWTDVFKMLPRRNLVKNISPACYCLKEISNKNVKCVHMITNADKFTDKLNKNDPKANRQLQHLADNKCQLSDQFRLTYVRIVEKNKAILYHCIDLFKGCQILLSLQREKRVDQIFECLNYLEPAKPFASIAINSWQHGDPHMMLNMFLRHPYIWNSTRIKFTKPFMTPNPMMPIVGTIVDWLHHLPIGVDGSNDGAEQTVRYMIIVQCRSGDQVAIQWLLNQCVQKLQQSQGLMDRRRFVLSFFVLDREAIRFERRHHNQVTGEVLLLEPEDERETFMTYRLRRCLAEEAANGKEFYEKMTKKRGDWGLEDEFVVNDVPMPMVSI